jgi:sortase A
MNKKILRICGIVWGLSGVTILASVIYPIASYELEARSRYPNLINPVVKNNKTAFENYDYTKASNWFVGGAKKEEFESQNITFYTISIPTLGIENAKVTIGGEDLKDSLIQYPGTQVPGKIGNSVIFGHSILPYFFNPKNYLSIFSTLPKLESGDEIFVSFDGISYKYEVESMFEVKPEDIQILDQDNSNSFLTLVTCTPPGHPLKPKRLIVRARLIPTTEAQDFTDLNNENNRN